ncbi:protein of unknown function [Salinimicrobium catena]|uniref:Uncharacterized protein n=1 Tax=Salinimicrobium catena TaxID=390640 RepID=A0A1H5P0J4_9FLAO|nr:DUF3857 domain-containing protein [Salinimicrobium catena]SDL63382.1 protein of unknown function [Salinimicrobium catena]SEF07210.1 protein of unknown function [Salinimicrobium catena]
MKKIYTLLLMAFITSGIWAQDFKFGKVSKEELEEKKHPQNKEAHAAVLYRSQKVYYDFDERSGFTVNTEVHERIKIYDKEGFDWATKEISYYRNNNGEEKISNLKAYTYNLVEGEVIDEKLRNNGIFQEEASNYKLKTKFTMPAIKEGSVIEFRYTLRSPFITTIDVTPLQYTIPLNKIDFEIKIPEFFGFRFHFNPRSSIYFKIDTASENFTYKITKQVREGGTRWNPVRHSTRTAKVDYLQNVYSIQEENIPALKKESYVDYLENYAAFIKWELQFTKFPNSPLENYAQTWEGVTKSIYNDAGLNKELQKTGFFEDDLDALLVGLVDEPSKARAIFEYVRKKVKWNDYLGFIAENGVKKAYKEGQGNVGDINLLLVSMLSYAGIQADPVLVSTRNNGIPLFPTRTGYNYVIAGISSVEGTVLLDASDPTVGYGELPDRARNWQGRIIRKDGSSDWVNLSPTYISENSRTVNVKLLEDLNVVGKCIKKMSGLEAKSYRDSFAPLATDEYIKILEKDRGDFIVTEVSNENKGSELIENYSFELKDAVENISDQIYLKPLLFTSLSENPFKAEERIYPIFFNYPKVESNTINMMIPDGYEVEHLPESGILNFKDGAITYKFLVTQNGKYLRIESILDINEIVFNPIDYKNLKDFYSLMVEKQTEAIVLKKI